MAAMFETQSFRDNLTRIVSGEADVNNPQNTRGESLGRERHFIVQQNKNSEAILLGIPSCG
jgi:hypothetical protein